MDFLSKNLFSNTKTSIISSLYGMISWNSNPKSPSPMQTLETHLGLKTLLYSDTKNPLHLHRHSLHLSPSPSPSSSSSLSSLCCSSSSFSSWSVDDLLGTENGVYMTLDEKDIKKPEPSPNRNHSKSSTKCSKTTRDYPPTIPLLARTGNLPGRMPWVLTRTYVDGRLILREERVMRHEYFEANRENGRLVLTLISLDGTATCHHENLDIDEELQFVEYEEEIERNSIEDDKEEEDDDYEDGGMAMLCLENRGERYEDLRMCYTYGGRMLSRQLNSGHLSFSVA